MKQNWQVSGTVVGKDSTISLMTAAWPDLTHEEAEAMVEKIVRAEMKKRNVYGVRVDATSRTAKGYSLIQKAESR